VFTPWARFLPEGLGRGALVFALTAFFALSQLGNWLAAVLAGRGDFTAINRSTVATSVAAAAFSSWLLWQRPEWAGAAAIIVLNTAVEALRVMWLGIASLSREREAGAFVRSTKGHTAAQPPGLGLATLMRYSALTFVGEALQFLTYRFDMWVVDAYRGAADLGRYSLAVSLAQMVWVVPIAAARVMFPYAAMLSKHEGARLAWRAARVSVAVCAVAAVSGWLLTQWLLTPIFGDQFAEVPALLGILLLGIVPYSISKVLGNYLAGINALGANVFASGMGLGLTIALDLLLIPRYGAQGAAWATAVSYAAYTLLLFAVFLRKSALPLSEALAWRTKE
jgi:O-antigen/teichoic acid export membrane protein